MRFGSVCSGIGAPEAAWLPLGWECAWQAEIEPFPSAVLAHRFPGVPNLGDITAPDFIERAKRHGPVQLVVGGTPCQSFSVAGLRKGLADPRGGLALRFLEIARDLGPRWVVWENVPGVLSSDKGRAFGAFLGGLGELGYGWSYRVLDAQFFGVAQRRRRVFVVGCLGDWRGAAAVLLERESLSGDPAPRREKGARSAGTLEARDGSGSAGDLAAEVEHLQPVGGGVAPALTGDPYRDRGAEEGALTLQRERESRVPDVAWCLQERDAKGADSDTKPGHLIPETVAPVTGHPYADRGAADEEKLIPEGGSFEEPAAFRVFSHDGCAKKDHAKQTEVAGVIDQTGGYAPGQGGTVVSEPSVYSPVDYAAGRYEQRPVTTPVTTPVTSSRDPSRATPLAVDLQNTRLGRDVAGTVDTTRPSRGGGQAVMSPTLTAANDPSRSPQSEEVTRQVEAVHAATMRVRRLTPRECERLQGFPDHFTLIPWKGRAPSDCPDGPRYRALGNSMAVPVLAWIGRRLQTVHQATA